jgi:hypothetical protein
VEGDELGFWLSGYHPQYLEAFSRDITIPAVNVTASVRLPLFAVKADGQPYFEGNVADSLGEPDLSGVGAELPIPQ